MKLWLRVRPVAAGSLYFDLGQYWFDGDARKVRIIKSLTREVRYGSRSG